MLKYDYVSTTFAIAARSGETMLVCIIPNFFEACTDNIASKIFDKDMRVKDTIEAYNELCYIAEEVHYLGITHSEFEELFTEYHANTKLNRGYFFEEVLEALGYGTLNTNRRCKHNEGHDMIRHNTNEGIEIKYLRGQL